jgi:hypothetical protein
MFNVLLPFDCYALCFQPSILIILASAGQIKVKIGIHMGAPLLCILKI